MFSVAAAGRATGYQRSRPTGVGCPTSCGSEWKDTIAVLPSEGNETRWEGTWGVGVLRKYL